MSVYQLVREGPIREDEHYEQVELSGDYSPSEFNAALKQWVKKFRGGYTDLRVRFIDDIDGYSGQSLRVVGKPKKSVIDYLKLKHLED